MSDPVLRVEKLVAGYVRDLPILWEVDLELNAGSMTVIIGPNGAGKSTLIKAIAGIVPVHSGLIQVEGRSLLGMRPDQMSRHGLAYVPQTDNIFRKLTIRQNLDLVLRPLSLRQREERREVLLVRFPTLREKQEIRAGALSGGQRQMLAIAMALAGEPRILLMDEPSAGLSPKVAQEVLEQAHALTSQGVSVLLVEQNVKQALRFADYCYLLADGRNQLSGPATTILQSPLIGEIYLGGNRIPEVAS